MLEILEVFFSFLAGEKHSSNIKVTKPSFIQIIHLNNIMLCQTIKQQNYKLLFLRKIYQIFMIPN